ncbi:MAG: macro domain-containing protein [Blastocatellia bacterium]|nr:macro domain-containing protein [Blastocatellia bacterium]
MLTRVVRVVLVDINPKMIQAWEQAFSHNPEVEIVLGSMLDRQVDAWVTPTNSRGNMDGGLDAILKKHFGPAIEKAVKEEIALRYKGLIPVGHAVCVRTGRPVPQFLISSPTMQASAQNISDTLNVALACAAAFQMIDMQNAEIPGCIDSVALPGLGANTGRVPVAMCAHLMWLVYDMFRKQDFVDFDYMRYVLEKTLKG